MNLKKNLCLLFVLIFSIVYMNCINFNTVHAADYVVKLDESTKERFKEYINSAKAELNSAKSEYEYFYTIFLTPTEEYGNVYWIAVGDNLYNTLREEMAQHGGYNLWDVGSFNNELYLNDNMYLTQYSITGDVETVIYAESMTNLIEGNYQGEHFVSFGEGNKKTYVEVVESAYTDDGNNATTKEMSKEEFEGKKAEYLQYKLPKCDINDLSLLENGYTISGVNISAQNSEPNNSEETVTANNIYNDKEIDLNFESIRLSEVKDKESAVSLLNNITDTMSEEEKASIKAKDQLAYLAEEAAARSAAVSVDGDIVINDENIGASVDTVSSVKSQGESILKENGLKLRSVRGKTRIVTTKADNISIKKENLSEKIDIAEAVTPIGNFEFEPDSVSELSVESAGTNKIKVDFNKMDSTSKVSIKFPNVSTDNFKAIVDEEGNTLVTKYNPVTDELSAKISESGVFTVVENEKTFDDIKGLDASVQSAIKNLASKGVIKGTSESEFSPESPITRAEVAALIVRILNADDPNADGGFSDVTRENWYFGAAGSSKRENIIAGYEDNTFRGTVVIPKVQIASVAARTLVSRLGYDSVSESYLNEFSDIENIPQWARSDISLAAYTNMVIRRTDNSFMPNDEMTRGDAAVIIEKLYDKVW